MRRNALCLSVAVFLMLTTSGCATFNKLFAKRTPKPASTALGSMDMYLPTTPASTATTVQPYTAPPTQVALTSAMPSIVAADPSTGVALQTYTQSGSRFHTVARKETLYSLARQYYGDHHRWKEIYEANKSHLRDPNKIFVGQRLAIP